MLVRCFHDASSGALLHVVRVGQRKRKATSTAWRAAQPQAPPVEFDELAGKWQPQTRALVPGRPGHFCSAERFEDQGLIFCPDSDTAIADGNGGPSRVDLRADADVTAGGGEF